MTNDLAFTVADVPPTTDTGPSSSTPANDGPDQATTDLTCEVCGVSLPYSGSGRKPKRCAEHKGKRLNTGTRSVRGSAQDVTSALAQMEVLYNLTAGFLMMANPAAAAAFADRADTAQQVNRSAFEADRRLARRVAGNAQSVGPFMFVCAQAYVVGPVLRLGYDSMRERRAQQAPSEDVSDNPFQGFTDSGPATVQQNGQTPA